jgi:hypothetical protein
MKLRAFKKDYFKIDVMNEYTVTYEGDKKITRWTRGEDTRDMSVNVTTDNTNKLIIDSPMPFTLNAKIIYVRDRNNTIIYEEQTIDDTEILNPTTMWEVISNQPIINALGVVEGYKVKTGAPKAYANVFIEVVSSDIAIG